MTLTTKQEKFCNNIVSGMTQIDAYKDAYDAENMKDDTIYAKACRMCKEDKISARIIILREPIVEKTQRTLETILEDIETLRANGMINDQKLALDCLKHEAKLKGYEIDKRDLTSGGEPITMPTIQVNGKKQNIKMGD